MFHPGSAKVKIPGINKVPVVKSVKLPTAPTAPPKAPHGESFPVFPNPAKIHPGSAKHPFPSSGAGGKGGAYATHKKFNF